ncbi:MAG: hypothetical protein Q9219_005075 [cf. Caloplaca sp. 3 TL-2023]
MQEKEPKYKDGHDPQMCTTFQRVIYLGKELRAAHAELDLLNKTSDHCARLEAEVQDLTKLNRDQKKTIDQLAMDNNKLAEQVQLVARMQALQVQFDEERMSKQRVDEMGKELAKLRSDHHLAKMELDMEKREQGNRAAALAEKCELDLARQTDRHEIALEKLKNRHLEEKLKFEQEISRLKEQQKPQYEYSYRGGPPPPRPPHTPRYPQPEASQEMTPFTGRITAVDP